MLADLQTTLHANGPVTGTASADNSWAEGGQHTASQSYQYHNSQPGDYDQQVSFILSTSVCGLLSFPIFALNSRFWLSFSRVIRSCYCFAISFATYTPPPHPHWSSDASSKVLTSYRVSREKCRTGQGRTEREIDDVTPLYRNISLLGLQCCFLCHFTLDTCFLFFAGLLCEKAVQHNGAIAEPSGGRIIRLTLVTKADRDATREIFFWAGYIWSGRTYVSEHAFVYSSS